MLPCAAAAAYQLPAVGRDGTVRPFEKPWFMVLLMFIGKHIEGQKEVRVKLGVIHEQTMEGARIRALVHGAADVHW
jgi:hypothetical protein